MNKSIKVGLAAMAVAVATSVFAQEDNMLGLINPDDIVDISILKDAAASAIYGARAANGVILVTAPNPTAQEVTKVTSRQLRAAVKNRVGTYAGVLLDPTLSDRTLKMVQVRLLSSGSATAKMMVGGKTYSVRTKATLMPDGVTLRIPVTMTYKKEKVADFTLNIDKEGDARISMTGAVAARGLLMATADVGTIERVAMTKKEFNDNWAPVFAGEGSKIGMPLRVSLTYSAASAKISGSVRYETFNAKGRKVIRIGKVFGTIVKGVPLATVTLGDVTEQIVFVRNDVYGTVVAEDVQLQQAQGATASSVVAGSVPGLQIAQSSAQPGSGSQIIIRGLGTVGNSAPLYVVDGVPLQAADWSHYYYPYGYSFDDRMVVGAENPSANITQALQGRVAGVDMQQINSQPGADMQIRIRGQQSLSASNDPLIVLDGMPLVSGLAYIGLPVYQMTYQTGLKSRMINVVPGLPDIAYEMSVLQLFSEMSFMAVLIDELY